MNKSLLCLLCTMVFALAACQQPDDDSPRVVLCIPVYGQSLALGEEAERLTDFDSLATYADGRIVTERLDHRFGYFDNKPWKLWLKRLLHDQGQSFELSLYEMARQLADATGPDTIVCIFPGGQGATPLRKLSKGTLPYRHFIETIQTAHDAAAARGWQFVVPAICWMQGESDICDYPDTDYQQLLTQILRDFNADILPVTRQTDSIPFIVYQPNSLTRAPRFHAASHHCPETAVPQTFVRLLQHDHRFWASGPTYPYTCVNHKIHIDARGQQAIGALAAQSLLTMLRGGQHCQGLIPLSVHAADRQVVVRMNVPVSPLTIDTLQVSPVSHYGFSVVNRQGADITDHVTLQGDSVVIRCLSSVAGCRVRYAVNGEPMKSGRQHGPRGNLRDAQGHWCYQFDMPCDSILGM